MITPVISDFGIESAVGHACAVGDGLLRDPAIGFSLGTSKHYVHARCALDLARAYYHLAQQLHAEATALATPYGVALLCEASRLPRPKPITRKRLRLEER